MKKKLLLIITAAVLLAGCKSFTREGQLFNEAKSARAAGDYHTAAVSVIESVRIDPEYADAIVFLESLYPEATAFYNSRIQTLKTGNGKFTNDKILESYKFLKEINDSAAVLPPLTNPKTKMRLSFTFTDYSREIQEYSYLAAEDHYQEGLAVARLGGRENAKQAAKEFETAAALVPGYKDAEKRMNAAIDSATQILAILPFANNSWNMPSDRFSELAEAAIISRLLADNQVMKYTRIVDRGMQKTLLNEQITSLNAFMDDKSRLELGNLLNANILVTGSIEAAEINGPSVSVDQRYKERKIIDQKAQEQGIIDPQTGETPKFTVSANIFYYQKKVDFSVTVLFRAVDVETGAILASRSITSSFSDSGEWARYSGDERALDSQDRTLSYKGEPELKSAYQMANEAAEDIGRKIAAELASYLR